MKKLKPSVHAPRSEGTYPKAPEPARMRPITSITRGGHDRERDRFMSLIEKKLEDLGLRLPQPMQLPAGVVLPFPWVRVHGSRAFVSGHGPQDLDGSIPELRGKVGGEVSLDEARVLARLACLSMLASLKRTLGDLDRVTAWLRVFGMVNSAPGFNQQPAVINGFSELILKLWGDEAGKHSRSAVGMAELPFGIPVEIEAEVEIDGGRAPR